MKIIEVREIEIEHTKGDMSSLFDADQYPEYGFYLVNGTMLHLKFKSTGIPDQIWSLIPPDMDAKTLVTDSNQEQTTANNSNIITKDFVLKLIEAVKK